MIRRVQVTHKDIIIVILSVLLAVFSLRRFGGSGRLQPLPVRTRGSVLVLQLHDDTRGVDFVVVIVVDKREQVILGHALAQTLVQVVVQLVIVSQEGFQLRVQLGSVHLVHTPGALDKLGGGRHLLEVVLVREFVTDRVLPSYDGGRDNLEQLVKYRNIS